MFKSIVLSAIILLSQAVVFANSGPEFPDCNCPSVTGISITTGITSATVSWSSSAVFSSYLVQIFDDNGSTVYFQSSTTGNSVVINGTSPSTNYKAKVFGVCGDYQSTPVISNFTTVSAVATCGSGSTDIGGDPTHPVTIPNSGESFFDQIDVKGDIDAYSFSVICPGTVTVTLSSMSNDYDLSVSAGPLNGGGIGFSSTNPGTTPEVISFQTPTNLGFPFKANINIAGFGNAYNTFDCYSIAASTPLGCLTGGGGENLSSGGGNTGAKSSVENGILHLSLDAAMDTNEQIEIQVFKSDGRLVLEETKDALKGDESIQVDLPFLDGGVYFANVHGKFGNKSYKFIVAD